MSDFARLLFDPGYPGEPDAERQAWVVRHGKTGDNNNDNTQALNQQMMAAQGQMPMAGPLNVQPMQQLPGSKPGTTLLGMMPGMMQPGMMGLPPSGGNMAGANAMVPEAQGGMPPGGLMPAMQSAPNMPGMQNTMMPNLQQMPGVALRGMPMMPGMMLGMGPGAAQAAGMGQHRSGDDDDSDSD